MWNIHHHFAQRHPLNGRLTGVAVIDAPRALREKLRSLNPAFRTKPSALSALQILPDGSLVRSTRIARMEAALLIADGAIPARKLVQVARLIDAREAEQLVQVLNDSYDRTRSAFRIEQTGAGYLLMTRAALSPWLDRLHNRQAEMKLSAPMMETLTIIAYQQPVTRADVEAIRGVQAAEMIRQLLDRGLIRIGGEDDSLGRPFLYITTRQFLSTFGLYRLEDLPNYATLRRQRTLPAIAEPEHDEDEDSKEAA